MELRIFLHRARSVRGVVSAPAADAAALCIGGLELSKVQKSVSVSSVNVLGNAVVDPHSSVGVAKVVGPSRGSLVNFEHCATFEGNGLGGQEACLGRDWMENPCELGREYGEDLIRYEIVAGHPAGFRSSEKPFELRSGYNIPDPVELILSYRLVDRALLPLKGDVSELVYGGLSPSLDLSPVFKPPADAIPCGRGWDA